MFIRSTIGAARRIDRVERPKEPKRRFSPAGVAPAQSVCVRNLDIELIINTKINANSNTNIKLEVKVKVIMESAPFH